jgi:hypothetical protein
MALNGSVPVAVVDDAWSGFLVEHLPTSPTRLLLLAAINVPVLAVVLNVLWQVVSACLPCVRAGSASDACGVPACAEGPLAPARRVPLDTLVRLRRRVRRQPAPVLRRLPEEGAYMLSNPKTVAYSPGLQYGNVYTFVLLGRKVTVAMGAKGNNFVLGGQSRSFNAEEAYKVRHTRFDASSARFADTGPLSISRCRSSARMSCTMSRTTFSWSRRNSSRSGSRTKTTAHTSVSAHSGLVCNSRLTSVRHDRG